MLAKLKQVKFNMNFLKFTKNPFCLLNNKVNFVNIMINPVYKPKKRKTNIKI